MGWFSADASSTSNTQNVDSRSTASEGSLSVGGGKFIEGGSDFSGASNVNITSDAAANQTISDITTNLTDFLKTSNSSANDVQKSTNDLLKDVLTKLSDQATAAQTGGQSLITAPLTLLGLALLAVIGFVLYKKL
jgi:hypothetical protein